MNASRACRWSTWAVAAFLMIDAAAWGQIAVRGETIYTMAGPPLQDGTLIIRDGKISSIGKSDEIQVPDGFPLLEGKVVVPGLIDAHATVGVSGLLNYSHDQDQLERSEPMQPELRAVDAYNTRDELVALVRDYGVTTIHTGHAPGELISGQTMVVKTVGNTVEDALIDPAVAVAVTLSSSARKSDNKSPGTRAKMMSMLRAEFIKAEEYLRQKERAAADEEQLPPATNLRLEALGKVLARDMALLVTADRAQDISNALRLAKEFQVRLWLDSAAEAYLLVDEIRAASVPVIIHPTMVRARGDRENLSFETAAKLVQAEIPVAMQSGYESYVPKTRVVLFEAGLAAAHGLSFDEALATITINAARLLGVQERVGSLEIGKDGDVAVFDGDPFEYTSHCTAVVIEGQRVSESPH